MIRCRLQVQGPRWTMFRNWPIDYTANVQRLPEPLAVVASADEPLLSRGQTQHDAFGGVCCDRVALNPHPVPPVDLLAASSTQQALTPAGAGPPQQHAGGLFAVRAS